MCVLCGGHVCVCVSKVRLQQHTVSLSHLPEYLHAIMPCISLLCSLLHLCVVCSMGGAVAAHTAAVQNCLPTLAGLIVIDVVEGE